MKHALATFPSLQGKVVFVTGGGSGIGADIVAAYAGQGAAVAFADRDRAQSAALVDRCIAEKSRAPLYIACDLTDMAALRAAVDTVEQQLGALDVLVNNTANDARHDFSTVTPEQFDAAVSINLKTAFFASQFVLPGMAGKGGGAIINLGSCSWKKRIGGYAAYATLKSSINGLTRSLAREYGRQNVRVNTLTPGWVMTARQLAQVADPEAIRVLNEDQCIPGQLLGQDIASMALFLGAVDSRMVTAQEFVVDAGWS